VSSPRSRVTVTSTSPRTSEGSRGTDSPEGRRRTRDRITAEAVTSDRPSKLTTWSCPVVSSTVVRVDGKVRNEGIPVISTS
jgi:hypothetical protein